MERLSGRDAVRPDETAAKRLRWLTGVPAGHEAESVLMEAVDYRGQEWWVVVEDCLRAADIVPDSLVGDPMSHGR